MAKTTEDGDIDPTYTVRRPYPDVIAVYGRSPPLMDLHGLMREWHHGGWRYASRKLARLLGAILVVCRSSGDEAAILRERASERADHGDEGPGSTAAKEGP
jgi:hypothetical protein